MAEGKTISRLEAAGALTLAALASPAVAQDAIRIGSFLAVTGPAAFLGEPEKKTLELYVDRINGEGGVLGQPLELVVYDTGMNAKDAVTFAKRLIEQDEVDAIIGGTTTGETMAVVKLMEEAGIPFISLAGASVIVDPVQKWVFKTPHTDRMAVDKVYEDMRKEGVAAIGLIGGAGGFDKSCLANAQELADEHGLEIKANETYGASDTDMTPQLTKIKNAGVDAVLFCGFGAASTIVTRTTPSSASSCRSTTITAAARSSSSTVPARRRKACGCPAPRSWSPTSCPRKTRRSRSPKPMLRPIPPRPAKRSRPSAATPTMRSCC
jgi:branched-chain amino acid transport system substrate-binding protein